MKKLFIMTLSLAACTVMTQQVVVANQETAQVFVDELTGRRYIIDEQGNMIFLEEEVVAVALEEVQ